MPDYAIVVGITTYPSIGDLEGPVYDADQFVKWLVDPEGAAIPVDHIDLIVSSVPSDPAATARPVREEIEAAFARHVERGRKSTFGYAGDRLYVYMSGHGFAPDPDDVALLMANASRAMLGYHVPARPFMNWFRKSGYFKELVIFMDCCCEFMAKAPPVPPPFSVVENEGAQVNCMYGFAAAWSQLAREKAIPAGGQVQGIFTTAVMEGLRGKAMRDGEVTMDSLRDYVYQRVPELLGPEGKQTPKIWGDPIVLTKRARETMVSVVVTWESGFPADGVKIVGGIAQADGTLPIVATIDKAVAFWSLSLSPGFYKLETGDGARAKEFQVAGSDIHVSF